MVLSYSFPQVVGEVHQNHKWKSEWHFIIFWELNSLVNLLSYLVFSNWIVENLVFLFGENTILPERRKVDRASNLTRSLLSSKLGNKHQTTNSTKPISFLKFSSWKQPILQRYFYESQNKCCHIIRTSKQNIPTIHKILDQMYLVLSIFDRIILDLYVFFLTCVCLFPGRCHY